jgi:oligosaccharyl transferase complex subunit OST4
MITDSQLYSLALFLGSASVLLIVLYHYLQVNAVDDDVPADDASEKEKIAARS